MSLAPELLQILQHSLGVDAYGRGVQYRSHFCPGGPDVVRCKKLAEMGLMRECEAIPIASELPLFVVTEAGKQRMALESPAPPKRTRSQKRYAAYLRADSDLPFIEWLKRGAA